MHAQRPDDAVRCFAALALIPALTLALTLAVAGPLR
jgi:hypothetical protein